MPTARFIIPSTNAGRFSAPITHRIIICIRITRVQYESHAKHPVLELSDTGGGAAGQAQPLQSRSDVFSGRSASARSRLLYISFLQTTSVRCGGTRSVSEPNHRHPPRLHHGLLDNCWPLHE